MPTAHGQEPRPKVCTSCSDPLPPITASIIFCVLVGFLLGVEHSQAKKQRATSPFGDYPNKQRESTMHGTGRTVRTPLVLRRVCGKQGAGWWLAAKG